MKRLNFLLLLICLCCLSAKSQLQQIKIVSFTVKNQLPAKADEWNTVPGALILVAQKTPGIMLREIKLVVQVRSNSAVICGGNPGNGIPVSDFNTKTFTTNELTGGLINCAELKDGNYTICAQFFNIDRIAVSQEVCRDFKVETPKTEDYSSPTLINPENGKVFSAEEIKKPLQFRWTPLVPKPKEPVTYRLKVWQLMQGQNGTAAMRTSQPIVTKDVDNITQTVVSGIYTGPCRPPYLCDFIWQVQAMDRNGKPMGRNNGNSEAWAFKVNEATGESKAPVNTYPENKKSISLDDAKKSIQFRWTPVVPKPQEPVTYKLRVWQLMQGQNGQQAMKNKPFIEREVKDVNEVTVASVLTGPCKPPYLCDFIWNVQATDRMGKPIGNNEGTSEATSFMVTQYIIQLDSIKVNCTATAGVYSFSYTITNPNPGAAKLTNLVVTGSTPGGASISSFSPPLNTTISSGNQLTITGTINGSPSLSNICIGAEITDVANTFWKASKDTCVKVLPCKCDKCDGEKVVFNIPTNNTVTFNNNNTFSFTQPLTITTNPLKLVKDLKAELVYYEYVPENEDCLPCNKDSKTYGNFATGNIGNVTAAGAGTHSLDFIFNPSKNFTTTANANVAISMPPSVSCCNATIRWCIRWVATFEDGKDCFVCSKLVCYEAKKDGCVKNGGGINDPK